MIGRVYKKITVRDEGGERQGNRNTKLKDKLLDYLLQTNEGGEKMVCTGKVTIPIVAYVYGKDAWWVRAGLISGYLPIGFATRKGKQITQISEMDSRKGRISYFVSPKKLYEETGFEWNGEKTVEEIICRERKKK